MSYCHGLPSNIWQTVIGTTSHSTVSLYGPIENVTETVCLILTDPWSLSHCIWYGCLCGWRVRLSFSHNSVLARLWQLPPSMTTLMDFPLMPARVWKMFESWSSFSLTWVVKTFVTTSDGLASCSHTRSSWSSSNCCLAMASLTLASNSSSLKYSSSPLSWMKKTFLFPHAFDLCPLPPHL